jgi:hypothetical protein
MQGTLANKVKMGGLPFLEADYRSGQSSAPKKVLARMPARSSCGRKISAPVFRRLAKKNQVAAPDLGSPNRNRWNQQTDAAPEPRRKGERTSGRMKLAISAHGDRCADPCRSVHHNLPRLHAVRSPTRRIVRRKRLLSTRPKTFFFALRRYTMQSTTRASRRAARQPAGSE